MQRLSLRTRPLLAALAAALVLGLLPARAGADFRPGVDYHRGRVIVSFRQPVADAIQDHLEGRATLAQVCGDDSLSFLFERFRVEGMHRLFELDDAVIARRGERTVAQAYWDHVRQVNERFAQRKARAPTWVRHIATYGIFLLHMPETESVGEAVTAFGANPHVEYSEPLTVVRPCYTPSDPDWNQLWGTQKIGCVTAWNSATGTGAVVGVIDTGVRLTHEDLQNQLWVNTQEAGGNANQDDDGNGYTDDVNGYDFGSGDADPSDGHGHGSHCSGTIGAEEGNNKGIAGVAFGCRIMALKIFGSGGSGDPVVNALDYARANGADATSNSYGSSGYTGSARATAINNCVAAGCLPIYAAGNDNLDGATFYPASYFGAFSVAASTSSDAKASFSCYGQQLDVTAPGTNIRSCTNSSDTSYANWQGTSMACPHVAGAMALFVSYLNGQSLTLSSEQMRQVLRTAAHDVNQPGWAPQSGYGRLDVAAMVAHSNLADVCEARISSPGFLTPVSGSSLTVTGTARHPTTSASFSRYTLGYAWGKAALDADRFETVRTSTSMVTASTLGSVDLTALPDGRYTLRLVAENTHGQAFRDRIEFVRDSLSDGSAGNAFLASATPVDETGTLRYGRNIQPASDQDWFRLELLNGETYEFRTTNLTGATDTEMYLYRSNGSTQIAYNDDYPSNGLKQSRIQWTCDGTGTYYVRVRSWQSGYPAQAGSYDIVMTGLFRDAFERDGSAGSAALHAVGQPADHNLCPAGDVDWASFAAQSGVTYTVQCSAFGGARVRLYDTDGSSQIGSDASANSEGYYEIQWTCPSSGTYYVRVDSSSSAQAAYTLVVYEEKDLFFHDDFATVGDQLWTAVNGTWSASSGYYAQTAATAGTRHFAHPGLASYDRFVAEAVVSYRNVNTTAGASAGIVLRFEDADDFLAGRIRANGTVELVRVHDGQDFVLDSASFASSASTDYHLRLRLDGQTLHLLVDGRLLASAHGLWFPGTVALESVENESRFDDVEVYWYRPASQAPFGLSSSQMPDGEFQEAYAETVPLDGGTSPFDHALLSGSLPPGLALASNGNVTGTPTQTGSWSFTLKIVDNAGRVTVGTVDIDVYDTQPPSIAIQSPADQDAFASPSQTLTVDISDPSGLDLAECRVGTGDWTALTHQSGDTYTADLTLALGSNIVEVRARDTESNEDSDDIEVYYDPSIPQITLTSHEDGETVFASEVALGGEWLNCVTLTVNGQPAALDAGQGTWSCSLALSYGANNVSIVGTDTYSRTDEIDIVLHHYLLGDVDGDGDVDEDDALLAARAEAGLETLSDSQILRADVNRDGEVDIRDAYAIRRQAAGFPQWKE